MSDILSLLIDHGNDDYDYYERLAVAVERLAVAVGLPLLTVSYTHLTLPTICSV